MGFAKQLGLVLWKNWLLQKRRVCVTIFEILIPVFFAVLFLIIRLLVKSEDITDPTYYNEVPIWKNHTSLRTIGYAPNNTATRNIMNKAESLLEEDNHNASFRAFNTEEEALDYFKFHSDNMQQIIVFDGMTSASTFLPKKTHFTVRPFTGDTNWHTRSTFPIFQTSEPRDGDDEPPYEERAVLALQVIVGEALIIYRMEEEGKNTSSVNLETYIKRMAYPPYVKDVMIVILQSYLPLFLILSFIISVVINTKNLVYEKERKLKESMKLMGLKASVYWASWFVTFMVYLIPAIILYAILLGAEIIPDKGAVLRQTNSFLFFLFLLCYSLSVVTFCFMVSTFVQKANVAAALSGILFFGFYFPYWIIDPNYEDMSKSEKLGSCLLFNCAMGLGAKVIGIYEGTGEGAQFSNFHKPGSVDDNLSLLECMIMLLVDCLIHLLITWYLENVRPGEFGVPKPFYFPFMKSYWCGHGQRVSDSYNDVSDERSRHLEKDPSNLHAGIEIKNLRKVQKSRKEIQI